MPTCPVIKMGNQQLATPSLPLTDSNALPSLIADMEDTMRKEGGVDIATPLIGVNPHVVIFGFEASVLYPNENPVVSAN